MSDTAVDVLNYAVLVRWSRFSVPLIVGVMDSRSAAVGILLYQLVSDT